MNTQKTNKGKYAVVVRASILNRDTGQYQLELSFRDIDGKKRSLIVDRSNSVSQMIAALEDAGANLSKLDDPARKALADAKISPIEIKEITHVTGWCDDCFVLPGLTIGEPARSITHIPHTGSEARPLNTKGTLQGWRDGLSDPCMASSALVFGISLGFAGPLLIPLSEQEGAFFAFTGETTTGKTTVARAGQSVLDRADQTDLITPDLKDRAVEEVASSRNGLLVVFDEVNRIGGKAEAVQQRLRDLTYRFAGGRGKMRSGVVRGTLPNLTWMLFGIVTWEDKAKDQRELRGEQVRLIRIPVADSSDGGIFDGLRGDNVQTEARTRARQIDSVITENYGVALPPYLEALVSNRTAWTTKAAAVVEEFVTQVASGGSGWDKRFARKFGVVLAGALAAVEAGVAPWDEDRAKEAVREVYLTAVAAITSPEEATEAFLSQIYQRIGKKKYFPRVEETKRLPRDHASIWGILRKHRTLGEVVAVRMSRVQKLIPAKQLRELVLRQLQLDGLRANPPGSNKTTVQLMVRGLGKKKRVRFLCLSRNELDVQLG